MISVYATYPLYDMCPGLEVELFPETVHIAWRLMRGIARDRRPWEVSMIAVCHVPVRSSTVSAYEPHFTLFLSIALLILYCTVAMGKSGDNSAYHQSPQSPTCNLEPRT